MTVLQKKSHLKLSLAVSVFWLLSLLSFALDVPHLQGTVTDLAGILSEDGKTEIENFLLNIDDKTQLQIAVLIIDSLEGESLEDYSYRVARESKLGSKERDSGALLLVVFNDKKLRIETGYGIEENLTDARSSQIIRNIIAPEFRRNNYEKGVFDGVQAMAAYALKDESLLEEVKRKTENEDSESGFPSGIRYLLILIYVIVSRISGMGLLWLPILLLSSVFPHKNTRRGKGSSRVRGFGYSSSSDFFSGFSGSSGGCFSGGGGSFGGGGASGGW